MASLFSPTTSGDCRLLDAGAGIGSLSSAFLERCALGELAFDNVDISAFEVDELLHIDLENTFASYAERVHLTRET